MRIHLSFALVLAFGWSLCVDAEEPTTLHGEYTWNVDDRREPLTATFESTGDGTWNVAFRFETRGRQQVYEGTAKGSLAQGPLEGEVRSENRSQLHRFEGMVESGRFEGRHANIFEGEHRDGGELILGLKPTTLLEPGESLDLTTGKPRRREVRTSGPVGL